MGAAAGHVPERVPLGATGVTGTEDLGDHPACASVQTSVCQPPPSFLRASQGQTLGWLRRLRRPEGAQRRGQVGAAGSPLAGRRGRAGPGEVAGPRQGRPRALKTCRLPGDKGRLCASQKPRPLLSSEPPTAS